MSLAEYAQILRQVRALTQEDQLQLAAAIISGIRLNDGPSPKPLKWMDLKGTLPYPALGEDAQEYITRTRQESDDDRERQWRPQMDSERRTQLDPTGDD